MARPVKWSRDLHLIREKAQHSRTETWSRQDLEQLFNIARASAQSLMKAIGEVQSVGGAHFVERASLLSFLDEMLAAPSVEAGVNSRLLNAAPPPAPRPLRVSIPADLRHVMMRDLPGNIQLSPGRLEITAESALGIVESLALLARAMQNDFAHIQAALEPATGSSAVDGELRKLFTQLRERRSS